MNNIQIKRKPLARWIAFALAATTVVGVAQAAAPLAGTEIKNLATVSYEDENGNKYTAQSNEAVITVAPQYIATLENDVTKSSAPGQTVYFQHTLTNTGNTPDTYALSAQDASATTALVYVDKNGDGEPDAGEAPVTSVTLSAGETVSLVVGHAIPSNATDGTSDVVTLTATSGNAAGTVKDIGDNADADTIDGSATNTDTVNITTGAVLVLTKAAVFDITNSKVTYTLTVKNTGGSNAKLVDIIDAVPMVDHDNDTGTVRQPLSNVAIISANGLLTTNNDTLPVVTTVDEAVVNADLNDNGNKTDASVSVIKGVDAVIAPNTTVSIVYSADYDPTWMAGSSIDNTFITFSDNNDDGTPETTSTSNTTHNVVPQTYGVEAEDDKTGIGSPSVNDGKDDDTSAANDTQLVDKISAGDTVIFTHTVTNTANGDDIFNLSVANATTDGFPVGTVFTLWSADGSVQLTDSDSDGIPDTGVLGQNASTLLVVKADLPAGAEGTPTNGYNALLTATSSGDDTQNDSTNLKLLEIGAPAVDLAALTVGGATTNLETMQANLGFNDDGSVDAHDEGPVLFANDAIIGGTVEFPMTLANESGSPDSFILSYADLPTGWFVEFKDSSGAIITATPFLPAGTTFNYTAFVTLSNDPAKAYGDAPTGTDGYDAVDDTASTLTGDDGDKDYVIRFIATSSVDSTRADSILHAVDVKATAAVSITPDGQNQIQPGGTVNYPHKLVNDGNIAEAVELVSDNAVTTWNSSTLIDTDGDGIGDTEVSNLTTTSLVDVYNPNGSTTPVTLTDSDGDGIVEFPLEPGQYVKLTNKVFAPADAPQGTVNATIITAQDPSTSNPNDPNAKIRNTAKDTSNVILGQVRLDKTVALQTDCTDSTTIGTFAAIQSAKVEPGQCAVWQIVAKNEGDALVKNVIVNDSIPTFTQYLPNSLQYCESLNCTPVAVSDALTDDEGKVANGLVTFYVDGASGTGTNSDFTAGTGGHLLSGESATMRFTVKIDQ